MPPQNNILSHSAESGMFRSLAPIFFQQQYRRREIAPGCGLRPSPATGFAAYANRSRVRLVAVRRNSRDATRGRPLRSYNLRSLTGSDDSRAVKTPTGIRGAKSMSERLRLQSL